MIFALTLTASITVPVFAASTFYANAERKAFIKLDAEAKNNSVGMPNSFTNCKTLKEAQKLAGFKITLPKKLPSKFSEKIFRVIKDELIEIIYQNKTHKLTIRKAIGTEDISGVYTKYSEDNTIVIKKMKVTIKGEDGKVFVATWTDGTYTYAISSSAGVSKSWMKKAIKEIQ